MKISWPKLSTLIVPAILVAIGSLAVALFFIEEPVTHYRFEVAVTTASPGRVDVAVDHGEGLVDIPTESKNVVGTGQPERVRLVVPFGVQKRLQLRIHGGGKVLLENPRFLTKKNRLIHALSLSELYAILDARNITTDAKSFRFEVDPQKPVAITFAPGQHLELRPPTLLEQLCLPFLLALGPLALCGAALWKVGLVVDRAWRERAGMAAHRFRARPQQTVLLTAVAAVILSSYPLIFLGRSMVSPNYGTSLLYDRVPTLPGMTDSRITAVPGSDLGAMPWQNVPYSFVQHEAIFKHGELPLWNRYNSSGITLIGQGQSMFGDPIHFIVIAANGASWAWDLKFLLAKWLLAAGVGLIVLQVTGSLRAAALSALTAPFCGVLTYRMNHPGAISFCYAPWILYCWLRLIDARSWRSAVASCLGLLVACISEMCSGTVKEAYISLMGMNFSGAVVMLTQRKSWKEKLAKLTLAAGTGVLLLLMTSAAWLTLLHSLKSAWLANHHKTIYQVTPSMVLGLFDEIFYRTQCDGVIVVNPSANFLALGGVAFACVLFLRSRATRTQIGLALAALGPAAFVFGIVPPQLLSDLPLVQTIDQTDSVFSQPLIVLVLVVAGIGYHAALTPPAPTTGRRDYILFAIITGLVILMFVSNAHTVQRTTYAMLRWGQKLSVPDFIWTYLLLLTAALAITASVVWRATHAGGWTVTRTAVALLCVAVLCGRFGLHPMTSQPNYFIEPAARADLHARSEGVAWVQTRLNEPYRITGLEGNLFAGWTSAYGLETHSGPDAIINARYRELLDATGFPRSWVWRWEVTAAQLQEARAPCDFLNVRFYADMNPPDAGVSRKLAVRHRSDLTWYESDSAWPRAFFTDQVGTYDTVEDMGGLVKTRYRRPFATMQRSQAQPDLPRLGDNQVVVPATDYRLTSNKTSFKVQAPAKGLVVLQETWMDDDFRVLVNGQRAECLRVNHAFKGVVVPGPGAYDITFEYWPKHMSLGVSLFFLALAVAIAAWCLVRRRTQPVWPETSSIQPA